MLEARGKTRQEAKENLGRIITATSEYETWYEFKKDLEKTLGYVLLNRHWLEVKPKAPLPWDNSYVQAAILVAATLGKQKVSRELGEKHQKHSIRYKIKDVHPAGHERSNGCEEWPDCDSCPLAIDECAVWYDGGQ